MAEDHRDDGDAAHGIQPRVTTEGGGSVEGLTSGGEKGVRKMLTQQPRRKLPGGALLQPEVWSYSPAITASVKSFVVAVPPRSVVWTRPSE